MPAVSAYAPGKIILFGEHAVVYNRPAIAVPVFQVRARAEVSPNLKAEAGSLRVVAPQVQLDGDLQSLGADHPISMAVECLRAHWSVTRLPAMILRINSTIPVAAGLGSSAAVTIAILRAVSRFVGRELPPEDLSRLAFKVEQRQHGTPSGIDNTVIAYEQPVVYQKNRETPFELLTVTQPFVLVIGDTGVQSSTGEAVGGVRQRWQQDPDRFEALFDRIGAVSAAARQRLAEGPVSDLGDLMNENQRLLREIGVSSAELDRLVSAALDAGASGAKLSGGGCGGNMIALAPPDRAEAIEEALKRAGAVRTLTTTVPATNREA